MRRRDDALIKISGLWQFDHGGEKREHKNLIVQSGLGLLAALFARDGGQTNDIPFHMALGTGIAMTTATDTSLQAEAFRKSVSVITRAGALVRLRTLFLPAEAVGTWQEFGIFLAGTDTINSGTLFSRLVPPGGITKTANTTLTIEVRINFSAG